MLKNSHKLHNYSHKTNQNQTTATSSNGKAGEDFVANCLKNQDFKILGRNIRSKVGELDIVAQKNEIIAFVEVKTRTTDYFNSSELIVPSKQRKIIATAKSFLMKQTNLYDFIYRFDVALVEGEEPNFKLTYIENAFTECPSY